jgi:hypothetical protein
MSQVVSTTLADGKGDRMEGSVAKILRRENHTSIF